MKKKKLFRLRYTLQCIVFILLSSGTGCSNGEANNSTSESASFTGAHLVPVDSIMIDVIGRFVIHDYQPESGLFLGADIGPYGAIMPRSFVPAGSLGLVVFNRQGEILHQFNQANDGPQGYGSGAYLYRFLGPDKIGVMGHKALYQYQLDGTFISKVEEINAVTSPFYLDEVRAVSLNGASLAMGLVQPEGEVPGNSDSIFQLTRPLQFYNLDENNLVSASHGYPDHPVFAYGSKKPHALIPPLMANEGALLHTIHPEAPVMYTYDIRTGALKNSLDLAPEYFKSDAEIPDFSDPQAQRKKLQWNTNGGILVNSRYHEALQLGDYTLLRYSTAVPEEIVERFTNGRGFGRHPDWPSVRRQHYKFYYQLLKNGEKVLPDFMLPTLDPIEGTWPFRSNSGTNGTLVGGNGLDEVYVFEPNNGSTERDYELIRVYKLEFLEE